MIFVPDRIFPVSTTPPGSGAMCVHDGSIVEIGRAEEVIGRWPDHEVVRLDGCVVLPGLINLHSHLEYAALSHLARGRPFEQWLPTLVAESQTFTVDDWLASARAGAQASLAAGITCVVDIVTRGTAVQACAEAGIGMVALAEVVAAGPDKAQDACDSAERSIGSWKNLPHVLQAGIAPHSIYTLSPAALERCGAIADSLDVPLAVHAAESQAEVQLLASEGAFADKIRRFGLPFDGTSASGAGGSTGTGAAADRAAAQGVLGYLDSLGCLGPRTLLVHAVHIREAEVRLAADRRCTLVACPRSNAALGVGAPDILSWVRAGVDFGFGTDSLASVDSLDLFEEVRAGLPPEHRQPERELQRLTLGAARALRLQDRIGSLEPGKAADFIALKIPNARSATEAHVIERASSADVALTVTGGKVRYRREDMVA